MIVEFHTFQGEIGFSVSPSTRRIFVNVRATKGLVDVTTKAPVSELHLVSLIRQALEAYCSSMGCELDQAVERILAARQDGKGGDS